jgi:hypothetical protein
MHEMCSRTVFDRLTTAGDCWLTYRGKGRFTFARNAPAGVSYEQIANPS